MRIAITSGATREPIDSVRYVSNVSSGRTGAALARAFLDAGHEVVLLSGRGAVLPPPSPRLEVVEFGAAADLLERLLALVRGPRPPAVLIHAAAVADYRPEPEAGKIDSGRGELVLRMTPTPKVADAVRAAAPDLSIVLFKLEAGIGRDELRRRARATLRRAGAQAIVANLLEDVGAEAHRAEVLRDGGETVACADRDALCRALLELAPRLRAAGGPA